MGWREAHRLRKAKKKKKIDKRDGDRQAESEIPRPTNREEKRTINKNDNKSMKRCWSSQKKQNWDDNQTDVL